MKVQIYSQRLKIMMALFICSGMLVTQPAFAESKPFINLSSITSKEKTPAKKKNKIKTKLFSSRNNNAVKIYPDFIKRDMHVIAKDNNKDVIDFFVFDLQGTLIYHKKMQAKEHQCMIGFKRGKYVYRVFSGDDETAAGEFEFR